MSCVTAPCGWCSSRGVRSRTSPAIWGAQGSLARLGLPGGGRQGRRRDLLTSEEREELKRLRKENAELHRANAILKDASVFFATELDPTRRR